MRVLAEDEDPAIATARVYCHLGGVTNLAVGVGKTCVFTRPFGVVGSELGVTKVQVSGTEWKVRPESVIAAYAKT
jgi:hypothetical protein